MYHLDSPDFTDAAHRVLNEIAFDRRFQTDDARLIYEQLSSHLRAVPFGDYLKRYIWRETGMSTPFDEVPEEEFRAVIRDSFAETGTPAALYPTTAKLSALAKNWLSQQKVHREVVLILALGLQMTPVDTDSLLTKALGEHALNPKSETEAICRYCLQFGLPWTEFDRLRRLAETLPAIGGYPAERTADVRARLEQVHDEEGLLAYLASLKGNEKKRGSLTARAYFEELYADVRAVIAELYNASEDDLIHIRLERCRERLARSDRMYDFEKQAQLQQILDARRVWCAEDIGASDIERVLYAEIPRDEHGNLLPTRKSTLADVFTGRRLTRQRISSIFSGTAEIERYDLCTLSFFLYANRLDEYPDPPQRSRAWRAQMSSILKACGMGEVYEANPYECFLLMCLLSEDPLGTYTEVWGRAYGKE